jgi:simple sugar transport system ATP-binding protein
MVGEELLRIVDVWKSYGPVIALRGVNMVVRRGEVVALLGDNGAGKSTLIKIISGYLKPDRGQLLFEGKPVHFSSPLDAKKLGIEVVHQDLAVILDLPVYRNIFLTHEITKWGVLQDDVMIEESKKALSLIKIPMPSLYSKAESLSGGQRQAVAVARALYFAKKLLLLDEPTSGLGVVESKRVIETVKKYAKEHNLGVVFVTPNIFQAYEAADRIYYIEQGKIIFEKYKLETSVQELSDLITNRIMELRKMRR